MTTTTTKKGAVDAAVASLRPHRRYDFASSKSRKSRKTGGHKETREEDEKERREEDEKERREQQS